MDSEGQEFRQVHGRDGCFYFVMAGAWQGDWALEWLAEDSQNPLEGRNWQGLGWADQNCSPEHLPVASACVWTMSHCGSFKEVMPLQCCPGGCV